MAITTTSSSRAAPAPQTAAMMVLVELLPPEVGVGDERDGEPRT